MSDGNGFVTRDQLRGKFQRRYQAVDVPSGLRFRLQSLSEGEMARYEGFTAKLGTLPKLKQPAYWERILDEGRRRLLALCLVDGDGARLYEDTEVDLVGQELDSTDAARLFAAAQDHCGIGGDINQAVEDTVKNLFGTIGVDSP